MEALKKQALANPLNYPHLNPKPKPHPQPQPSRATPEVIELPDSEDEGRGYDRPVSDDDDDDDVIEVQPKRMSLNENDRPIPRAYTARPTQPQTFRQTQPFRPGQPFRPSQPFRPANVSAPRPQSTNPFFSQRPTAPTLYNTVRPVPVHMPTSSAPAPVPIAIPTPRPFSRPPYGYIPNRTPAVVPTDMFAHKMSISETARNGATNARNATKPPVRKGDEEDEGEDFDLDDGKRREDDWDVVDPSQADKHMRELLEQALGDVQGEFDEKDSIVEGFREGIQLMPHQVQGCQWMKSRESGRKSFGILADDMGLGKTVQTLARIVDGRPTKAHIKAGYKGGTLIICPLPVMKQWEDEVKKKTRSGLLKVTTHQGVKRETDADLLQNFDVVITTYDVIRQEYDKYIESLIPANARDSSDSDSDDFGSSLGKKKGAKAISKKAPKGKKEVVPKMALFKIKWHRIVLDEAQNIKNRTTKTSQGCVALQGKFRWCLTGTPIQNNVDELYPLFAFLRCRPLDDWDNFREQISKPVKNGRTKYAMRKLHVILKAVMLRRLKTAELNGKRILNLPPRNVNVVTCRFDADERAFYQALTERTALTFSKYMKAGAVMSNYTSILTMLLRLRQACDHPILVSESFGSDPDAVAPASDAKEDKDEADELADLLGGLTVATAPCSICSTKLLPGQTEYCSPACRSVGLRAKEVAEARAAGLPHTSAKIREILKILKQTDDRGLGEKTIIFSQFTKMLDVIQPFLKSTGVKFVRYDGSMDNVKRELSLTAIKTDPSVKVILISFKAGGVGLNLTCANNVILTDLWWNPALEEQAFDRAHRLGQNRAVHVHKLVIEETVEDRILLLQEKKRELAAAALSGGSFKAGNKLNLEDIMALFKPQPFAAPDVDSDEE
ncbi:snf2 family dna-dependent atpase [Phaffia rhodozyma]|uniref:Snf2 family dna-dependent atpase n=1 Tax=Phaffia rhodozyma TaxID=264483 RepID=A0A0F7SSE8_PHARH|nr:snf2 family dna-dependent atpase [Phaffia rhodozyma]